MKKAILILLVILPCGVQAKADGLYVQDTLSERVINGLKVVPIRRTYDTGEIFWRLRIPDFEKNFQKFESKYLGMINYNLEFKETIDTIFVWQDYIWNKIIPIELKRLGCIDIQLYINENDSVFAVEFSMWDDVFQKLSALSQKMLKNVCHNLEKERCNAFREIKFRYPNMDDEADRSRSCYERDSVGIGKEYIIIRLS